MKENTFAVRNRRDGSGSGIDWLGSGVGEAGVEVGF